MKCLESLDGKVDDIWVFDGKWEGFNYPSFYSDDGTDKLVLKFARTAKSKVHLGFIPAHTHQYMARTMSINVIPEGDWILIIDSDEYVTKWTVDRAMLETTTERGFRVCFRYDEMWTTLPTPKFFKKIKGLEYTTDHRLLKDENGIVEPAHFKPLTDIMVDYDNELSANKKMRKLMEEYKNWLRDWEVANPSNAQICSQK